MNWWLWHRLRAMSPEEAFLHFRRKMRQRADAARTPSFKFDGKRKEGAFPVISSAERPEALLKGIATEAAKIMSGEILAFGHLPLRVDTPPNWQKDYLAGIEVPTSEKAFRLNHRGLTQGADIKLIWELSRWQYLVKLAQAAALLKEKDAAEICVRWLADWEKNNPPYYGWNWTSALESGMRLIQLAWLDALVPNYLEGRLSQLLPAHVYFTWRYRSFGSSANNHLFGELAGLIIAIARWPSLERWATSLEKLQALWEREVLAQFAADGGNKEQALNYHLFSFEFCWQTRAALIGAGRVISATVEEQLRKALPFFVAIQSRGDHWDYGDSDSAFVAPLASDSRNVTSEWLGWMTGQPEGAAIKFWMGEPPVVPQAQAGVTYFQESGQWSFRSKRWFARWDLSTLGYLSTAAHGHLDALHFSLWLNDQAIVIDPGTSVYYQNKTLRAHLASWQVHNAPFPAWGDWPKRLGPFLWKEQHRHPSFPGDNRTIFSRPEGKIMRAVIPLGNDAGFEVEDSVKAYGAYSSDFEVRWHFAPGTEIRQHSEGEFSVRRGEASLQVRLAAEQFECKLILPPEGVTADRFEEWPEDAKATVCSQRFREITFGPVLSVRVGGGKPCVLRTTFLASAP